MPDLFFYLASTVFLSNRKEYFQLEKVHKNHKHVANMQDFYGRFPSSRTLP